MSEREEIRLSLDAEQVRALHGILTYWLTRGVQPKAFNPKGPTYNVARQLHTILGACTAVKDQTP